MRKSKKRKKTQLEPDSAFLLKIVMYLIVGAQWIRVVNPSLTKEIPIPFGLIVGLMFAMHDHFRMDRKIEYAILLVAMFIGFWAPIGIYVNL